MVALQGALSLDRACISLVGADLSDSSNIVQSGTAGSVGGGGSRVDEDDLTGDFRQYANGVTRLIIGTTRSRTQTLALRALTPSQVAAFKNMAGKICLFRDTYGRKIFGSFLTTSVTDIPLSGRPGDDTLMTDVGFVFTEVSFDESV